MGTIVLQEPNPHGPDQLVLVFVLNETDDELERILDRHGCNDPRARVRDYRSSGFTSFVGFSDLLREYVRVEVREDPHADEIRDALNGHGQSDEDVCEVCGIGAVDLPIDWLVQSADNLGIPHGPYHPSCAQRLSKLVRSRPRKRARIVIEFDLDPVAGSFCEPVDYVRLVQRTFDGLVPHYHPIARLEQA